MQTLKTPQNRPSKNKKKQQNASRTQKNPTGNEKTFKCKSAVTRGLRKTFRKHGKNIKESLGNVNKDSTFAPATAKNAHRNTGRPDGLKEKKFSKKDPEKLAGIEKAFYICTPQNRESSLTDWRKDQKNEAKKSFINFSSFSCRIQKEVLVLHPL